MMGHSWSRAAQPMAPWPLQQPRKRLMDARTVAVGCDRVPNEMVRRGRRFESVGGLSPLASVSQHLNRLATGRIVDRRKGTSAIYWINDPTVIELCELACRPLRGPASARGPR
jgi:hypothetical protein